MVSTRQAYGETLAKLGDKYEKNFSCNCFKYIIMWM